MLSNYPDGAANDPRAPYNQETPPLKSFDVSIEQTLIKECSFESSEYLYDEYDEDFVFHGDAEDEWTSQHMTIEEILKDYIAMLQERYDQIEQQMVNLQNDQPSIAPRLNGQNVLLRAAIRRKINDAKGWSIADTEFELM